MSGLIMVLEDMDARVDWLREIVGDRHEIRHARTVPEFLDRCVAPPDLTILDHDLGGPPRGMDPQSVGSDGLTGLDCCDRMPVLEHPVLVWSINPARAPMMVRTLQRRGVSRGAWVEWAPYGTARCGALIARALMAAEARNR